MSSDLTINADTALGPPLIGALMRMPLDAVLARMLARLHAAGFTDLVPAHFSVLRYPGPQGRRPSDLAAETGMTKQAMNYLLCLLYTSPSPRDGLLSRMPSSA